MKTKHDLQETQYQKRVQKQRAYYEKKVSDLDYMLQEQTKRKQKDLENQQLQEKLTKAAASYSKQLEQMEMESQKLKDKLQKTESCYFKLLEEAKKRDAKDESSSSPTSPANKNVKAAQAARPTAGSVRLHCDSAIVMIAL